MTQNSAGLKLAVLRVSVPLCGTMVPQWRDGLHSSVKDDLVKVSSFYRLVKFAYTMNYTLRGWKLNYRWIGLWIVFFDPTDRRYPHRRKEEWKNTAARHSSSDCGIAIFRVWIRTLRGLRYPGTGSLSEYEPILKIFAIYSWIFNRAEYKFTTVQSI